MTAVVVVGKRDIDAAAVAIDVAFEIDAGRSGHPVFGRDIGVVQILDRRRVAAIAAGIEIAGPVAVIDAEPERILEIGKIRIFLGADEKSHHADFCMGAAPGARYRSGERSRHRLSGSERRRRTSAWRSRHRASGRRQRRPAAPGPLSRRSSRRLSQPPTQGRSLSAVAIPSHPHTGVLHYIMCRPEGCSRSIRRRRDPAPGWTGPPAAIE